MNLPKSDAAAPVTTEIRYTGRLSDLRIRELHNIAKHMGESINSEKYACDNYYDYVCSHHKPLYSIMGHMPGLQDLIDLLHDLEFESEHFLAKKKIMDFVISCHRLKTIEECYRQSFEYFKPLFGYIITKKYIDSSSHEHKTILELLERFLKRAERTENFIHNPIRLKLVELREKFRQPHSFFETRILNEEYRDLRIYRESYEHNVRNLELHRRRNSTFENGTSRTMLEWTLYLYQSRNKPMSYYYPTLNVHLWMSLYNTTERWRNRKTMNEISECLKLPQFVNVLEEARVLAVVYLKSFRNAYLEYSEWIRLSVVNEETFDQENAILKQYYLDNKKLFLTLYAQNFCDFGMELAENVFYLGLKESVDFFSIYSCGYQTPTDRDCLSKF